MTNSFLKILKSKHGSAVNKIGIVPVTDILLVHCCKQNKVRSHSVNKTYVKNVVVCFLDPVQGFSTWGLQTPRGSWEDFQGYLDSS